MAAFGITSTNFDNIVWLRITTLVLQTAPIMLIWMLPELDEKEGEQLEAMEGSSRDDIQGTNSDDKMHGSFIGTEIDPSSEQASSASP